MKRHLYVFCVRCYVFKKKNYSTYVCSRCQIVMSEPNTPPPIERRELRTRHRSKKRKVRSPSSSSSSPTSRRRKSRSVQKKRKVVSRSSSSTSSSSDRSRSKTSKRSKAYSGLKRRRASSRKHKLRDQPNNDSVLLQLVAAIEGKNRTTQGYSGQNVIPEFDPQAKVQSMKDWLSKINETAAVYGWTEKQTIYYSLPRLIGLAKRWYDGLTSVKFSWREWQEKLLKAFPCEDNYGDLLTEMLSRKSKRHETLEEYYYDKLRLINRCEITGIKAVDCLTHGIFDNNVRMNAQGLCFKEPEDVLTYFRKISTKRDEGPKLNTNIRDRAMAVPIKRTQAGNTTDDKQKKFDAVCFNCNEKGHFWQNCPRDLVKCGKCRRVGHNAVKCDKYPVSADKAPSVSGPSRSVLKIQTQATSVDKYYKNITVNGRVVKAFVDLGSECTLISDKVPLENVQIQDNSDLPLLKGFANGSIRPSAKVEIRVQIDYVTECIDAFVVPASLLPEGTSLLVGQNLTELPETRIFKTDTELIIFKSPDRPAQIVVKDSAEINGVTTVPVIAEDCPSQASLYIASAACLKPGSEYLILPGVYNFTDGCANIIIMGLNSTVKLAQGQLIARGIMIPEFFIGQPTDHRGELKSDDTILNVCRLEEQLFQEDKPINVESIRTDADLDKSVKDELCQLLTENKDCFAFSTAELGRTTLTEMHIKLKDETPVTYRPYRLSYPEREKVKNMIEDLCTNGIIRESESEYASPIIIVPKKNGDIRLCVDYRALNKKTCKDKYPMPLIEDQIDNLSGQKYFTTLDLASGYHQIPIAETSKHLTAFVTQEGHYEYNRMPFGLCNAPAVFQRLIHKVLNAKKIPGVLAYMDDIVIASENITEGMIKLREVLAALREAGLTLNLGKCNFFRTCIDYLGYEISDAGVKPGQKKIDAVASFKKPESVHEVRQFIGLASFFRRFVKGFASIARPLTSLTKANEKWTWGDAQESAFREIKNILMSRPILAIYNPKFLTELHTDASQIGIGGILMQRPDDRSPLRAVAYFSRQTTAEERHFHSFELETLAVVASLNRFRVYLLGLEFKVVTDCNAVRLTWTKRDLVPRIARWWLQAQEFNFSIEYRPGTRMTHVDALSRNPVEQPNSENTPTFNTLKISKASSLDDVQFTDPHLVHLKCILNNSCAEAKEVKNDYTLKDGKLYRKVGELLKWVVPLDARWRVCHMCHDESGHMAYEKTLDKMKQTYWFSGMSSFVKKYVRACIPCAYAKQPAGKKEGFLFPIPKTAVPFHSVHIDHLGPFVKSKLGNTYILGIIDAYTKFIVLRAVRNTKSKTSIAVLRDVFGIFGAPKLLISDRGTSFTSSEFAAFAQDLEIKHIKNAVAMPRANGQIERYNRTILASLAALTHGADDKEWDSHLNMVQWSLNNTLNKGIGRTPSEVIFGKRTVNISEAHLHDLTYEETTPEESCVDKIRDEVSQTIEKNQDDMAKRFNKSRCSARVYELGDLVLVQKQLNNPGESNKLLPRYSGPYRVTKILGHNRYEVSSIEGHSRRKYQNVFAVDKIKPWIRFSCTNKDAINVLESDQSSDIDDIETVNKNSE